MTLISAQSSPESIQVDGKSLLRARLRAERKTHVEGLPQITRALILSRPPAPIAARVPEGSVVGLYHANPFEAPTGGYARWFHENGRHLALPWFADRSAPMQFRAWRDPFQLSDLVPGPWGALQPEASADELVPDFAFVPLLGFTAKGHRLGQGGGHYDRWLAEHPGTVPFGLAWDIQKLEHLPQEPHDRRLSAVITPTRIYEEHN
jgi:5-formyltetrahydrofolate cyclo-ligase